MADDERMRELASRLHAIEAQGSVSLREHIVQRIEALEKQDAIWRQAAEEARDKAAQELGHRLAGMNEFREQLEKQASRFVTRAEMDACAEKLAIRIQTLEISKAELGGKASQQSVTITIIMSIIGLLIGLLGLVLRLT